MRPPRVPRSPLFAVPSLSAFLATLAGLAAIVVLFPMDELERRDVDAQASREHCYALDYEGVAGRAFLFAPDRKERVLASISVSGTDVTCPEEQSQHSRSVPRLLTPGKYRLILIAGRGSHVGARATGTLTLFPTSGLDRSPSYPNERARTDTTAYPMYGATDLDFRRVGAPIEASSVFAPPPTSLDPLHPGVLTHFDYPFELHRPRIDLLIGTVNNVRAMRNYDVLDGAGIVLSVRRIAGGRVFGDWGRYGIVSDGSGEFYIEPFDSDSLDIIERPAAPPSR